MTTHDRAYSASSIADEDAQVAREVRPLVTASGLAAAQFAEQLGTSASRLSTYCSGKASPSATLMVRMRRLAHAATSKAETYIAPCR